MAYLINEWYFNINHTVMYIKNYIIIKFTKLFHEVQNNINLIYLQKYYENAYIFFITIKTESFYIKIIYYNLKIL